CQAECEGFEYEDFIECDIDNPCDCDLDEFDPVCVATPSGLILTFQNECLAECQGYDESTFFDCDDPSDCECYQIYAPVCVTLPDGEVIVFPNDCYAQCEGFGPDEYELCDGAGEDFCEAHFDVLETDVPGQIQFLDYSFVIDAEITAWFWDFGDGYISDEQNPVHTYDITGMVDITLTITTDNGCSSTTTYPIFVGSGGGTGNGPECQAMFTFEQDEEELLSFYFEDLSMGEDVDSWFWSFGDGNSSTEQNPEYTYAAPGLYFVTLTITSGTCTSSMSMIILTDFDILYDEDCLALFVPLKTDSLTYAFLNLSSNFEADFAWDFGDGNTSNEPMPVHTYAAPGNYEVVLTLTTPDGCSSSFTATINPVINGFTGQPSFLMSTNTNDIYEQPLGQIKAYPNPATSRTTLDLDLQEGGAYQLRLLNLNGQEIWNQAYDWNAGRQQIDLDLSTVPAGMLMLQVQGKQGIETLRLIKQ
ncbi:MAG: PKD domain-containing protein, partial [Mameliella sp.]|nr:PKD domain-containing protein [Phaeodactylibacter sp.]